MVLSGLSRSLKDAVRRLVGSTGDIRAIREFIRDVQRALLRADVNVEQVLKLSKKLENAGREEPPPGYTRKDMVLKALYEELIGLLGGETPYRLPILPGRANIIMLVGIQGSGKTTTAAKLANYYRKRGYRAALICADTYRPGAYDQLKQLADMVGVPIYGEPDSNDPVGIAKRGVEKFSREGYEVIIIDTAGRHKEEKGLINEMKEIAERVKPNHIILVIDATIGQSAYVQAKAFHEATKIGSIFVTKLDGAARGGGALSAVVATGAPISFIGTGEKIDEIEEFDPPSFINRLLGMGDLKALVDRMREAEVKVKIRRDAFLSGRFTLRDLVEQIEEVRKMGPLSKILSMLPGMTAGLPDDVLREAEKNLKKWRAIVDSMTEEEIQNPKIIDRSRIRRIARGSGTTPGEVRMLLRQYNMLRKNIKQLRRKGLLARFKI